MSYYNYIISEVFINGLSESQLMTEMLNESLSCINVVSEDDICGVFFSELEDENLVNAVVYEHIPIEPPAEETFDVITANTYNVNNPLNNMYSAERANLNVVAGMENDITGIWSSLLGNLAGFNTATGEMVFGESGIYLMKLQIETASLNLLNNMIHIKLRDGSNNIIMAKSEVLAVGSTPVYAYIGYGGFFTQNSTMKITLSVDTANLIVDVTFSITKLLSS